MTYKWQPTREKPMLSLSQSEQYQQAHVTPGSICIEDGVEEQGCPAVITEFLNKMEWEVIGSHPDTTEPLFIKKDMGRRPVIDAENDVNLTEGMLFRWYEAVAYEHAKMMSIGLGD